MIQNQNVHLGYTVFGIMIMINHWIWNASTFRPTDVRVWKASVAYWDPIPRAIPLLKSSPDTPVTPVDDPQDLTVRVFFSGSSSTPMPAWRKPALSKWPRQLKLHQASKREKNHPALLTHSSIYGINQTNKTLNKP